MRRIVNLFLTAVQFSTRIPVPRRGVLPQEELASAAAFFPLVGLLVASGGVVLNFALSRYLGRDAIVLLMLVYLVMITGGLHEDGLADAADGFGGGWEKEQILSIMHDSRIGSFGALAVSLSLLARFVFLTNLSPKRFVAFLVAGQVLSRWTALPLGFFLPPARGTGQGALVARKITGISFAVGTALAVVIVTVALGVMALWAMLASTAITAVSAAYYRSRIDGVTGDCLGATIQITEATVYLSGVILK